MKRQHYAFARAPHPLPTDEWIGVVHAAKLLGVSRVTVYKKLATGELKGETHAGRIVIKRTELQRYLVAPPHPRET